MIYLLTHSIDNSADKYPQKIAFICGKNTISYADLRDKTNQLARALIQAGAQKGDRIGVYLNRSLETCIAIYGIMKAGCAYVPLDPSAPASRIQFQIEDCGIQNLVSNPNLAMQIDKIVGQNTNLLNVFGFSNGSQHSYTWEQVFQMDKTPLNINLSETDLAYIMYTSGTTGVPKGIMHTHKSGLSYAKLSADLYQLSDNDIIGNHAPLYFDISTLGYFTSPLIGATTVIVPEAFTKLPSSLGQLIANNRLTVWYSVPLALIQLLQNGCFEHNNFSTLRWILFGGEVFHPKHLLAIMQFLPNCTFSNVYGPAEVNQCTFYNISQPPALDRPLPLGKVWEETEALILNEDGNETNSGEAGELFIHSTTMMQGYWNLPKLTEKSFYTKKEKNDTPKIFYRTGDLVYKDDVNELHFIGRKDRQVKVRGYRVELEEISNVLLDIRQIDEVAVFDLKIQDVTEIWAHLILKSPISVDEIYKQLSNRLPKYAHPSKIEITREFPRSPTGKIEIKKLVEEAENTQNE